MEYTESTKTLILTILKARPDTKCDCNWTRTQSSLLGQSASTFAPALNKEFLDIQATRTSGFTLKRVRDMIRTYNQIQNI